MAYLLGGCGGWVKTGEFRAFDDDGGGTGGAGYSFQRLQYFACACHSSALLWVAAEADYSGGTPDP